MRIIDSITIRYFRSVYTLSLSKCQDITVITGKNDVGKSNILKALNLFFCQQTDYNQSFSFFDDYSFLRRKEVRQDTIRGQQFISISVRFIRGDRMQNSLPPSFTVTKKWDMHTSEYKQTSDVHSRMINYAESKGMRYSEKTTTTSLSTFLNRIRFIYIPAIKDEHVFAGAINTLQESLFDSKNQRLLDEPIGKANLAIQSIISDLQDDFERATGIKNQIELPTTLNYKNGLLQVNTPMADGNLTIDKRGDGIRTHYIPKILHYVATHSKNMFIWGFEEPENSYEYYRCMQVADEFDNEYCNESQIFITSHSPAFFSERENKYIVRIMNENGKTVLSDSTEPLEQELGYINLYRRYLEEVKKLQAETQQQRNELAQLHEIVSSLEIPLILTEGKTDTSLLKLAIQKLGLDRYARIDIRPILSKESSNNDELLQYLKNLRDNEHPVHPIIGMFDRDTPIKIKIGTEDIDVRDKDYVELAPNVYAFAIPIPHGRTQSDQVSIEHYFTDDEIKTELDGKRLYLGYEFYSTGVHKTNPELFYKSGAKVSNTIKIVEHESKNYVTKIDGSGDFSLSKAAFVNCLEKAEGAFSTISFEEFRKIFDILDRIIPEKEDTQQACEI